MLSKIGGLAHCGMTLTENFVPFLAVRTRGLFQDTFTDVTSDWLIYRSMGSGQVISISIKNKTVHSMLITCCHTNTVHVHDKSFTNLYLCLIIVHVHAFHNTFKTKILQPQAQFSYTFYTCPLHIICQLAYSVVPENIHTPPTESFFGFNPPPLWKFQFCFIFSLKNFGF